MANVFDSNKQSPVVQSNKESVYKESPAVSHRNIPDPVDSPQQNKAAEDAGMLAIGQNGGDLSAYDDGYKRAKGSGNPAGTRTTVSDSILNADVFAVQQQAKQFILESAHDEQDMLDALEASQRMTDSITERMKSPIKGQREAARAVSDGKAPTQELDMAGVDRKIQEDLATISDDTGWEDYAWSVGRQVLSLGTISLFDAAGLAGAENLLDVQEKLQVQALEFQTIQDPAAKLAAWESLKAQAFDELPQADAAAYLQQMALASGTVGFEEFNDAAIAWGFAGVGDVAGLTVAAGKGLTSSMRTLPRAAKELGNTRLAGEANAKSLEEVGEEAAKRMGMSGKREAADNAHPVAPPDRTGPNGEAPESSLSLETQQVLQAHRAEWNTYVDNLITGKSVFKETGQQADIGAEVVAKVQARAARYVESIKGDVQQAAIKQNDDGSVSVNVVVIPKGHQSIPTSKELGREGNRLARMVADGMITQKEADTVAATAKAQGSSLDSIRNTITELEEGIPLQEALQDLDAMRPKGFVRTFNATLDDRTGAYSQERLPIGAWARSNRAAATTPDTIQDFEAAARLDNISAKIAVELSNEVKQVFGGLPLVGGNGVPVGRRKAKLRIQQALIEGDEWVDPKTGEEVGKVFTPDELVSKFGLSEKEIESYYKLRNLYDSLYKIRDAAVREELVSRGFADVQFRKKIRYTDEVTGEPQELTVHEVARPIEDGPAVARSQLDRDGVHQALNSQTGTIDAIPEDMAEFYRKGGRIVQFREPVSIPGQGRVRYAMVDALHEIRDLPQHGVTQYKTGYVPRIYDRGVWFVKKTLPFAQVDGRRVDAPLVAGTRGMTDNEAAARALVTRLQIEAEQEGDTAAQYQVFQADQVDPLEMALSGASGSGGRLYTSSRGSAPVPFYRLEKGELVDEKASRVDAFEALQSNINNVAFHYPRNEWRISTVLRLQNTAKKLGVQWNSLQEEATGGTTQARAFINRKRLEMQQWLALPDSWETRWNETLQTLYEKALGVKVADVSVDDMLLKIPSKGLWWLKSHDPVTALRAATFHLLLGWGNPAQWFVQAQGFSPAFAQAVRLGGPQNVIKIWKQQHALRTIENAVDRKTAEGMVDALKKAGITEGDEGERALALYEIWSKSGLRDGVLTTGDFKNASNAMGQGYGALADFANNKGLWFYRQGELFSRRFSLTTAFDEFLRANPDALKKGITDAQQKAIVSKANDHMLNLGKANKAAWQRGVLSVPTQFWQVQAKLLEQYLTFGAGKVLSTKEKFALALGQVGLYGAAGVPVLGAYGSFQADMQMDPDGIANRTVDEGLYGFLMSSLGADVEVAQRGAILADVQGLLYDFLGGDKSLTELMLGAGNTTLGRIGEAIQRTQPLAMSAFDQELPTTQEDFVMALDAVGDMSSTWTNATKAWIMSNTGIIYARSGKKLAMDQYNFQTLMMTAMGFTPRQEGQAYALGTLNRMASTAKSDIKRGVRQYMLDLTRAHTITGKPIGPEDARKFRAMVGLMTSQMTPMESKQMLEDIQKEVLTGETELAKATQAYMRVSGEMIVDDLFSWYNKAVIGQQAIQEESIR